MERGQEASSRVYTVLFQQEAGAELDATDITVHATRRGAADRLLEHAERVYGEDSPWHRYRLASFRQAVGGWLEGGTPEHRRWSDGWSWALSVAPAEVGQ